MSEISYAFTEECSDVSSKNFLDNCSLVSNAEGSISLSSDGFGTFVNPITKKKEMVCRFTWKNNRNGMLVQVISYGATITKIKYPNICNDIEDVVLGFDDMDGYLQANNPYFGATVGRVANRIANGEFGLNGKTYQLARNWNGLHHLHGGLIGFDKLNWTTHVEGTTVKMTLLSVDGSEFYPGDLLVTCSFRLESDNTFHMNFTGTTSKPTPINLTNHSYFNLAGHGCGHEELYKHIVQLNCDKITATDAHSIPTGKFECVGGTPYDLRTPKVLGPAIARVPGGGFDSNFCVTKGTEQTLAFVARVIHPESGRVLEVYSDQPGVQFYTGNFMPDPSGDINPPEVYTQDFFCAIPGVPQLRPVPMKDMCHGDDGVSIETMSCGVGGVGECELNAEECEAEGEGEEECELMTDFVLPINGKEGALYTRHGGFCLETQKYPDAVHHCCFPTVILRPGELYTHQIIYKFGLYNASGNPCNNPKI